MSWLHKFARGFKKTAQKGIGAPPMGEGGTDICVCPECGYEVEHERGVPCAESTCPKCDAPLVGKEAPMREEVTPEEELELLEKLKTRGKLSSRITVEELSELCPTCAEFLKGKGVKSIGIAALGRAMLEEEQKDKDKISYTFAEKNRSKWETYWASITGGEETFEACVIRLAGSSWIDDPTDFCTDLQRFVEGSLEGRTKTAFNPDEVEQGDYVDFGPYGKHYVCDPDYQGADFQAGEWWWITDNEADRANPRASGHSIKPDDAVRIIEEYEAESKGKTKEAAMSEQQAKQIIRDFVGQSGVTKSYPERMFEENLSAYLAREGIQVSAEDFEKLMDAAGQAGLIAFWKGIIKEAQLPKGWTMDSVKKFWSSVGGSFTTCVSKLEGVAEVDNPEAFCAWMHEQAEGKWPAEASLKKGAKGLKPGDNVVLTERGYDVPQGSYGTIKKVLPNGDYEVEFVDKGGYVKVIPVLSDFIERSDIGGSLKGQLTPPEKVDELVKELLQTAPRLEGMSPEQITQEVIRFLLEVKGVSKPIPSRLLEDIMIELENRGYAKGSIKGIEKKGVIVQEKGKWCVKSKDKKKNLGCYGTKAEAVKRLQQVEYFKSQPDYATGEDRMKIKAAEKVLADAKKNEKLHLNKLRLSSKESPVDVLKRLDPTQQGKEAQRSDVLKDIVNTITRIIAKGDTIPTADIARVIAGFDNSIMQEVQDRLKNQGYTIG